MTAYLLSFFAYAFSYVSRKAFSACMSGICSSLSITKAFAGAISTGYLACYGAGQLVNGIISDKTSPRLMIAIGLLGAGLCNVAMGVANSGVAMLAIWCMNGFFNSTMWSSIVKTIANWVPDEKRSACATAITTSMALGTIFSYVVASFCLENISWRATFWVCGGIVIAYGFVWIVGTHAIGSYLDMMEKKASMLVEETREGSVSGKTMSLSSCILATGILFTIGGILFNGIIKDGVTEWVPTYFTDFYGMKESLSSLLSIALPVVSVMGSYLAKFIFERNGNEMLTSGILFGICFASLGALRLAGSVSPLVGAASLAVAVMTMHGVNNMFLTIIPLNFKKVGRTSSVSGVLNACSYVSAALSSVLIGVLAQNMGWNATVVFWVCFAGLGVLLCCTGAPVWSKGRKRIG